jgi:hypothetical protein
LLHSGNGKGSEVRTREEVAFVLELVRAGWNDCEIARETGIPRQTILDWRSGRTPDFDRVYTRTFPNGWVCLVCRGDPLALPQPSYTYLLGLYLGDGYIPPMLAACTDSGSTVRTPIPS